MLHFYELHATVAMGELHCEVIESRGTEHYNRSVRNPVRPTVWRCIACKGRVSGYRDLMTPGILLMVEEQSYLVTDMTKACGAAKATGPDRSDA
jgi:hypothetical protein